MTWWKIVAYIFAVIMILLGVLFILGSFDPTTGGGGTQLLEGLIMVVIGFVAIYFAARKPASDTTNVTMKIDLSGSVSMDTIKCKSCGGTITKNDITMVAGAPMVTCPYCHTSYQLTEEPKW
jgi:hypothetical protein